jgi:GT2 family glycosyltransferase
MRSRTFMLVYFADPCIREMTLEAVGRFLATTTERDALTVAFNGEEVFPLPRHERVTVVPLGERLGIAVSYNRIVNATNEPYIGFLHNDCLVPKGAWMDAMIATATRYGFAFPKVRVDELDAQVRAVQPVPDALPPSCCYVMARDAWQALKGFDEFYDGVHFEDTDLFMRGIRAGYTMARAPVEVFHRRGVTRSLMAEESNHAFFLNRARYAERWRQGDTAPLPYITEAFNG